VREHTARCGRSWAAEAAGTALLVASILLAAAVTRDIGYGLRFLALGALIGPVVALIALSPLGRASGAHLNPAVTLAFWARGRMTRRDTGGYLAAQLAGAVVGAAVGRLRVGRRGPPAAAIGGAVTHPSVSVPAAVALEAGMTLALLAAVFARATPLMLVPLLVVLIWLGSPPTGASFNPARSEGPALVFGDLSDLWLYLAAPSAAALALGALSRRV
jgi:aquaporin Z